MKKKILKLIIACVILALIATMIIVFVTLPKDNSEMIDNFGTVNDSILTEELETNLVKAQSLYNNYSDNDSDSDSDTDSDNNTDSRISVALVSIDTMNIALEDLAKYIQRVEDPSRSQQDKINSQLKKIASSRSDLIEELNGFFTNIEVTTGNLEKLYKIIVIETYDYVSIMSQTVILATTYIDDYVYGNSDITLPKLSLLNMQSYAINQAFSTVDSDGLLNSSIIASVNMLNSDIVIDENGNIIYNGDIDNGDINENAINFSKYYQLISAKISYSKSMYENVMNVITEITSESTYQELATYYYSKILGE